MSKYRDNKRPGVLYTRNFILRSLCGIYLMAFVSFYYQSEGRYLFFAGVEMEQAIDKKQFIWKTPVGRVFPVTVTIARKPATYPILFGSSRVSYTAEGRS